MQALSLSSIGPISPAIGPVPKFNAVLPAEPTGSAPSSSTPSRIESFGLLGVAIGPVPISRVTAVSAAESTGPVAPAVASSGGSSPSAASTSAPDPSKAASGGTSHASSASAPAASSNLEDGLDSSYSTTVGGTQYSGLVGQSGGEYTASVASLLGATASGSSEQAAENNLDARIDELV